MKIKQISMKNFANFHEFTCNLSQGVNYCIGSNGSGKSTTGIISVWCCLQGIAERGTEVLKGKRSMWVGKYGNDAEVTIILTDPDGVEYTVNRKILENKLEITASDGRKLDQKWVDSFWNQMMLSPVAFSRLSPKEQAAYMGIDTAEYDQKISELKDEAKIHRAMIKGFGEIEIPDKVEPVDVSELSREKDEIVKFNQEQRDKATALAAKSDEIKRLDAHIAELQEKLQLAMVSRENRVGECAKLPQPQEMLPTDTIDQKISEASEVNAKAIAYQQAVEKQAQKEKKEQELSENKSLQDAEVAKKVAYMQELDLPFSNLSIDDNGGLMMDGRPIQTPHFSTGELIKICTMLLMSQNKDENGLRYVYLENFDLLDDTKSKELLDWMMEENIQVLCERVVSNQPEVLILQDKI